MYTHVCTHTYTYMYLPLAREQNKTLVLSTWRRAIMDGAGMSSTKQGFCGISDVTDGFGV